VAWRWDGTDPEPALPPPANPAATAVVAKLANSYYHSAQWLARGWEMATQHGLGEVLTEASAEDLLRAALHPPPGPSWLPSWEWAWRVAHAAAFVAGGYPGWDGTWHRELLLSMLATRSDWLAVAASAAAGALGDRGEARDELRRVLTDLVLEPPTPGYWCVGWPATCALYRLWGDADPELRDGLVRRLRGWEDPDPADASDA
jgi:hypothetical protein